MWLCAQLPDMMMATMDSSSPYLDIAGGVGIASHNCDVALTAMDDTWHFVLRCGGCGGLEAAS